MPSIEFLRLVLGVLGIGCAHMAARAWVAARKGWQKQSKVTAWLIRTVLCVGGLMFRHPVDRLDIVMWILMIAAAVSGWWFMARPRPQEDLTKAIFPDEK